MSANRRINVFHPCSFRLATVFPLILRWKVSILKAIMILLTFFDDSSAQRDGNSERERQEVYILQASRLLDPGHSLAAPEQRRSSRRRIYKWMALGAE
jgi:hypothetical protein